MGNSGSQHQQQTGISVAGIASVAVEEEVQWSQSFPRTPYQHKLIVPDRDAHQRLRPTGNGEILHAGGTISGRNQQGVSRSSSIPAVRQRHVPGPQVRTQHKQNARASSRKDQLKRFGSEPDLRLPSKSSHDNHEKYKGRKKYKAPPPPPVYAPEFDDGCGMEGGSPIRRARLFKTRAETKKKYSSPVNNRRSISDVLVSEEEHHHHRYKSSENLFGDETKFRRPGVNPTSNNNRQSIPQMQRTKSSPEFQEELREATKRLVETKVNKLRTLDHNLNSKKEHMINKLKDIMLVDDDVRTPASGKESSPEQSPPKVKTFYFGMEHAKIPNSLGSDISSESETETSGHDISLQLRPILPKKQLEIPRFSPAAAWKLLSAVDTNQTENTMQNDETSAFIEDKIEKLSRPPPPYRLLLGSRSIQDKSGDSGISGDETPEVALPSPRQRGISWTPQQDLGDDSSLEDGSNPDFPNHVKFPTRPHVFSLSLPRENHLAAYINEKTSLQPYSSLQKLKRSMSGVLATLANKRDADLDLEQDENWFLSKSAPNSLNNGFNSLELRRQYRQSEDPVQTNSRRIMYLPQSTFDKPSRKKHLSKSYDNLSAESRTHPENLQDPPRLEAAKKPARKTKKFTFQSTVRQIERKRLADKLSKEAERKEQKRLQELEAMQRVEEEFQKKRAREKATIRQQLRLYNMDDTAWSSLPPNLDLGDGIRPEPDGAVCSSSPSPSPTFNKSDSRENKAQITQILSEFRQSQREYKEFINGSRYIEQTTVYPRVTFG
ncbi:PREDICTED: uncharacterized protein LOC108568897 isoform X2 [Nicrophorus vespilloides]|uniref:Uncharacterized protein LOC108568897 isoform X2 n=1 Tax=Nicrophorus vespilloides TaxID=110193 RepID=A0ABM1NFZ5_NICVS|nr:PREDICTED: uncharacterized protein LOC108568897 isoform X2 [Nicrophorus vespilloides]